MNKINLIRNLSMINQQDFSIRFPIQPKRKMIPMNQEAILEKRMQKLLVFKVQATSNTTIEVVEEVAVIEEEVIIKVAEAVMVVMVVIKAMMLEQGKIVEDINRVVVAMADMIIVIKDTKIIIKMKEKKEIIIEVVEEDTKEVADIEEEVVTVMIEEATKNQISEKRISTNSERPKLSTSGFDLLELRRAESSTKSL